MMIEAEREKVERRLSIEDTDKLLKAAWAVVHLAAYAKESAITISAEAFALNNLRRVIESIGKSGL